MLEIIGKAGGSIKDVRLDEHFGRPDPALIRVFLTVETRDFDHVRELREKLVESGFALAEG